MIWLIVLLLECCLLSYLDRKIWGTFFTPLHFLMVPYVLVVLVTLAFAGNFGLPAFYYPSLLPWIAGLPFFSAAGYGFSFLFGRVGRLPAVFPAKSPKKRENRRSSFLLWASAVIGVVFSVNLFLHLPARNPSCGFGSDCFGQELVENVWVSHLMVALMALVVIHVFRFDRPGRSMDPCEKRSNFRILFLVLFSFFALFVHQVKSWMILPLLAGIFARILDGKTSFGLKLLFGIGMGGILVFFLSYFLVYVCGDDMFVKGTALEEQVRSIARLFVHYVTSGTMGLSIDMQQGILETPGLEKIFTPFVNLWNLFEGREPISAHNPEYVFTGLNYTNVRSFFGTLFVFTQNGLFLFLSFLGGAVCYGIFFFYRRSGSLFSLLLYAWICVLLFMGWFDLYVQLSNSFEIPCWIFLFMAGENCLDKCSWKKKVLLWK